VGVSPLPAPVIVKRPRRSSPASTWSSTGPLPYLTIADLRNLAFLDSTGLEAIMKCDARLRAKGSEFVVVRGPRAVERLFDVMQLDQKLRIVDDPGDVG